MLIEKARYNRGIFVRRSAFRLLQIRDRASKQRRETYVKNINTLQYQNLLIDTGISYLFKTSTYILLSLVVCFTNKQ